MTPSMTTNGNARGRATTRAIENAAVRLALDKGAAALTVDEICNAAGIKQRTFFNHFATKEDALLGAALPRIHEGRVREYLSDTSIGVLTGALELIELPARDDGDDLDTARLQVLAASPALAERQASRLIPLAGEIRGIIRLKLSSLGADRSPEQLDSSAALITRIASSLLLERRLPGDDAAPVQQLAWVWDRML
ncbi:helix-turn-helix domain-containing protein [Leifsonia shinshuensis]|uniref:TetR/AcrR family transcriptional regulator n=1 Tax=Leifsonia shinshuensis TaxID=150026 RepID=UPI00285B75A8|nr:helix-turn-helix domain-containing protein [Leifsonia shinshuensis]MDR6970018.1 AcrR family transcriptional regulator [Leifsonia shinshuensis]